MLCRLVVTCALLGHVVLSLPAARAPRYTPLPDEVDSDETRRVLGSSVVTSVSVIMDLGNGSQALFSEPSSNHHGDIKDSSGKPIPLAENHLFPEKRPVGSPPALLSPDRYEFYTFDESGELVRRLMTLEQIQSLIAGGDDANRIAAIPLDIEIDTEPSPLATDPQGQVVASVQQVLAEELLASTKKNGTEPHETEVEVEAEVQEVPPPPSSPRPEEEKTQEKVSTEAAVEIQKISSTTQMSTESLAEVSPTGEMEKEEETPVKVPLIPIESKPEEESYYEEQTTIRPAELEMSSSAIPPSEEELTEEVVETDAVQDNQTPIEATTEELSMIGETEEDKTPLKVTTEKQEETQEYITSAPSPIASDSEVVDEMKESSSTEATSQEGMETTENNVSEASVKPEMEVQESEKIPETPMDSVNDEASVTLPSTETSYETEKTDQMSTDEPNQLFAESEDIPAETEIIDKNPPIPLGYEQPLIEDKPTDETSMQTPMESSPEMDPSELVDRINSEITPTNEASMPSTGEESDNKDVIDEVMPTEVIVEEIPPSPIPSISQVLEEADLSAITYDVPPSKPVDSETPLQEGNMDIEKNPTVLEPEPAVPEIFTSVEPEPAVPEILSSVEPEPVVPEIPASVEPEAAVPEIPAAVEPEPELSAVIPTNVVQEVNPIKPSQGAGGGGNNEEVEESEEDEESILDQLAESVSSVLSQVTGLDDEDYDDEFRKKPLTTAAPMDTTEQTQDAAQTVTSEFPGTGDASEGIKEEEEITSFTESIIPDMRDPTKDTSHGVSHAESEKIKTPTILDIEKEDITEKPADTSEEKVSMVDEAVKEEESEKVTDDSTHEEPTTVSESIQDKFVPLTTTESNLDVPMSTEKPVIPSSEGDFISEEPEKDTEDNESTQGFDIDNESTTTIPENQEKVGSSIPEMIKEDEEKSESASVTESTIISHPTMEDDSTSMENPKPTEEDEIKETLEMESTPAAEPNDITTMKPSPMDEDAMKEEEVKVKDEEMKEDVMKEEEIKEEEIKEEEIKEEEKTEEDVKKNEQSTEHYKEDTTENIVAYTTEKQEEAEKEAETTVKSIDENNELKVPNYQPTDDGVEAVKGVQADLLLIENLHKEAALNRDPLFQGNDPPQEESTHIPIKIEEPTTMSHPVEASSAESVANDDVEKKVTSPSPAVGIPLADAVEELKPSHLAAAVEEEMESEPPTDVEEEPMKVTAIPEVELLEGPSDKETSKNPWTSIPIPLAHHTSTTPESEKQSYHPTPSTTDTDELSFSSASPDDFPDPNGLLPLLTEKPSQFTPNNDPLTSTTNKSPVDVPSTTDASSTTQEASTTEGRIVPPLMSAFPAAPQGNVGLESTSASTDPDVKRFVDLCNDLAFALYGQVTSGAAASSVPATRGANGGGVQTRSLVVSPFALTSLLAMVFLGARGRTSEEMNDLLRLDDMITFNPHLVLQNVTDAVITSPGVSAAAFVRELYSDKANGKLLEFYKARAKAFYDGHVEEVDFKEVNDVLRRRTNHLVRWQTRGRVPEYLRGSSLKLRSPLAALSANFFEADCQRASSTGADGEMYFEVPSTGRRRRRLVPVPAVVWRGVFLAGHDPGLDATVLELRHGGGEVSTVLVLPGRHGQSIEAADVSGGLTRLENWLINGGRESWSALLRSALPRGPMEVQLPRFAHRSVLNATGALGRMGLQHLFQDGKADLGGLDGGLGGKLHLADIIQMTAFGVCADDGSSKRHLETYPSAQRTGRKHARSLPDTPVEESPEADTTREGRTGWMDELAREEENSYVFAAAAAARELPLAVRPRQARIPRPALKQHSRVVLPRLRFDRPFLYFVRHNPSGFILLMGRFNPRLFP